MKRASAWFLALAATGSIWAADAGNELVIDQNIVYGKGGEVDLKLDLYRQKIHVEDPTSIQPGLIVIHGGAWRSGNKESMRVFCEQFARNGYVVASISYRLIPTATFPSQVEDCKCAVRWMRANADTHRIDPDRIGAMGGSAGGHLAMMLGYMDDEDGLQGTGGHEGYSSQVQCVVNYFGPFIFTIRDWKKSDEHLLVDFLGGTLDEAPEAYRRASPATYVDSDDAPTITLHGTQDPLVPYGQAALVHAYLRGAGVDSHLELVPGAAHGWLGKELQHTQRLSLEFLDKHLKGPKSER
jgi:acetyl esterase/lipase